MKSDKREEPPGNGLGAIARAHWAIALIAALSTVLLFTNLGRDYLWSDEGDTAVLAGSIVKYGVPRAWDGVTFTDSDKGARENEELVMVSHPWVQYYLCAASFLVFGETTFAARFPFALAGLMTILLVYALVRRITPERSAACCAALLTVLSVQFLLYSRQCRNYSLSMLFTCCLFWTFFRMRTAPGCVLFAVTAILLFHSHPFGIAPLAVLGLLTLFYQPFRPQRRWFWVALPPIILLTLPWLARARAGYEENRQALGSAAEFLERFTQYLIECASVTPLIGITILLAIILVRTRGRQKTIRPDTSAGAEFLNPDEASLILFTFGALLFYAVAIGITQSATTQWFVGIRYAAAAIPLLAMTAGILIIRISRGRALIWVPLLVLFSVTKLGHLTPWITSAPKFLPPGGSNIVAGHKPVRAIDRFVMTEQWLFLGDLGQENLGTVARTSQFLRQHANPGEILITNYSWEPLYFHTRLPQGLKILPDYPVAQTARRKGLPDYVFNVDHVRWVVWRPIWEGYQGYQLATVVHDIVAAGGQLNKVVEISETFWENRENVHFRRFSGGKHIFAWPDELPPTVIFKVEWPEDARVRPSSEQNSPPKV